MAQDGHDLAIRGWPIKVRDWAEQALSIKRVKGWAGWPIEVMGWGYRPRRSTAPDLVAPHHILVCTLC